MSFTREDLNREIAGWLHELEREPREKNRDLGGYLNNFHGHLPGGYRRKEGYIPNLDERIKQDGASQRLKSMTHREFYEHIDRTIEELGLDTKSVAQLVCAYYVSKDWTKEEGDLIEYVLPVYLRLRENGFLHYPDLTA